VAKAATPAKQTATSNTGISTDASEVVERFKASWDYAQANHHPRWERNWKLYNNKRVEKGYEGITNTFVPMTFSVVETITAALANGRPSIEFTPQDMYQYIIASVANGGKPPDLKPLNAMFDYYWDCDSWDIKSVKTVRNGLIYGTSAEYIYWDIDKPRVVNLSIRDLIIDPDITDPLDLWNHTDDYYVGRRFLVAKSVLEAEEIVDPDTGQTTKRYKDLDKVDAGMSPSGELTEREIKDMAIGSLNASHEVGGDKQVEVIELWYGGRVKSVANRAVCIEDRENKLGFAPFVIHRFIADESIIYGKAIIDPIAAPQEYLNDITNQRVDAVTDVLSPQYELDPAYADWLEKVGTFGAIYPFKPGSLAAVTKPSIPQAAFNETSELKNEIRETTAADQVIMGVNTSFSTTATEIKAQLAQAGQRFDLYVMMLEKEAFYQRAKIVYKMMRHFLKDAQLVPTTSIDGPKFYLFDPKKYDDSYEPSIKLQASVDSKKQQQQSETTKAYQEIIADPTNDLYQAKKILYPKMFDLSEEELDKIIGTQPPAPGMGMGMGGAGMPGDPAAQGMPQPAGAAPPETAAPLPGEAGMTGVPE
jgi:hypothetical protein